MSHKDNQNHPLVRCCLHVKEQEKEKRFVHSELRCAGGGEVHCVSEIQIVVVV